MSMRPNSQMQFMVFVPDSVCNLFCRFVGSGERTGYPNDVCSLCLVVEGGSLFVDGPLHMQQLAADLAWGSVPMLGTQELRNLFEISAEVIVRFSHRH
jgi:hypothetical protein